MAFPSTAGSTYVLFYLSAYLSCFPYPLFIHSRRLDAIDDDDVNILWGCKSRKSFFLTWELSSNDAVDVLDSNVIDVWAENGLGVDHICPMNNL
jgi:hypothetical protein